MSSKPIDEVTLERVRKTKVQDQQKDKESRSSEPGSPKIVSPNKLPTFDITDDDDFNSSTIAQILKETIYPSEDEKVYESFMFEGIAYPSLADVIKQETKDQSRTDSENESEIIYKGLAKHLADYSGGEFPKEFEAFGEIKLWEQMINFTEPSMWSVFSLQKASGIFSKFSEDKAQLFYIYVLLPRLRKDLKENGTLTNPHLSIMKEALKRKPLAFFKGVILPLCKTGGCTLQEAIVFSSILENFKVNKNCAMAVLLLFTKLEYSGACSILMKELLDQGHDLSIRIDDIVAYFLKFMTEQRTVPVMWHECLVTFLINYRKKLTPEQKENLFELSKVHKHDEITRKIQKKLGMMKRRGFVKF